MFKKIIATGGIFFLIGFAVLSYDEASVVIKNLISPAKSESNEQASLSTGPCGGRACNVILIVSDTLSAENMSLYGYQRETTPFLSDLAKDKALVFDNSMSSASWTPPSMMALFYGRPPHQVAIGEISKGGNSLVSELKNNGVDIAGFLKALPPPGDKTIITKVVNNNFSLNQVEHSVSHYDSDHGKGFLEAAKWINERNSEKPYFVFIHDTTVHDPYDPPQEYRNYFNEEALDITYPVEFESPTSTQKFYGSEADSFRIAYDQEVRYLDDQLRTFVSSIGSLEDTVVIFTSDHGEIFGEVDNRFLHGRPLEVIPSYAHNQVVRTPLVVFGGGVKFGRSDCPVSTLDLAPTVFALMGVSQPDTFIGKPFLADTCANDIVYSDQTKINGVDMLPIMNMDLVVESSLSNRFFTHNLSTIIAAQDKRFKVIEGTQGFLRVYDLKNDPKETRDLSGSLSTLSSDEQAAIEKIRAFMNEKYNE